MERRIGGILGSLALLASAAGAADRAQAMRALDYGDAAAARAGLAAAAAEASFWLGVAEAGDAREAAAERALALADAADSWVRPAASGLLELARERWGEAAAALREATAENPSEARLWKLLGDALRGQGDYAGASTAYERAVTLQPAYPTANIALGDLAREQGDFGNAYNAYNHAVDENDEPPAALIGRAAARLYLGDERGALADLETAAERAEPGVDRHRALLGVVLVHAYARELPSGQERAEEAIRMWQDLGRADMAAAVCNAVGRVVLETGNPDGAERWYERGWQTVESSDLPAGERTIWKVRELHGLARAAARRRDLSRARELVDEAERQMAADPDNAEHYAWIGPYLTGYIRLAERRWDDAVAELQKSDLERPHIMMLLAEAYSRARERDRAREWYEKAFAAATGLDTESVIVRPAAAEWLAENR